MNNVCLGILGTTLDRRGKGNDRWQRWRPTLSLCQHDDFVVDRLELLIDQHSQGLAKQLIADIAIVSPETRVNIHLINFSAPWDFETVYSQLLDFARTYPFKTQKEKYFVHITTGTHVAQICWFLLTEAGYIPASLIQTSPARKNQSSTGEYQIIDLDLSKYDQIASRFKREHEEATDFLKNGIATRNTDFNRMIAQLEQVSLRSDAPILLTGPTGAGKSQLASKIFELRQQKANLSGHFVAVNCATLRGDNTMSVLFGHKKGAFTGATRDRPGLLVAADQGLLFLDEIAELGLEEQAMLLRAIEDKRFMPLGADTESSSDFQLIAGTNKDLNKAVQTGTFREDLLARIDLWTYQLPSLRERIEDLEPNIDFELERFSQRKGLHVQFNKAAKSLYMRFCQSPSALWSANFRDLNASITRMCTLADSGRINSQDVKEEIKRLQEKWQPVMDHSNDPTHQIDSLLGTDFRKHWDLFDQYKILALIKACQSSYSMAEAGRKLFAHSRENKISSNDSHRIKQLLSKYQLSFEQLAKQLGPNK